VGNTVAVTLRSKRSATLTFRRDFR